jgi:glycosyltransferase involved in cell wall biosynthesis
MRVCYFGLLSEASSRHSMHPPGLRAAGDEVVEWTAPVWLLPGHSRGGAPSGISAERAVYELGELGRTILRIAWLTVAGLRIRGPVDAVVVSEFNHALTPLARIFARRWGARLVVDFCFSFYDTAVNDRRALGRRRPRALYRRFLDATALRLADTVITETPATAEQFDNLFGGVLPKAHALPLGVEDSVEPQPYRRRGPGDPLRVLYVGTFIPLHGVDTIIEAARLLRDDERIRLTLVGKGQTRDQMVQAYERDPSGNVDFPGYVPDDELRRRIGQADVCLGVFGTSEKARRVFTHKVWEALASGRPVVTGDGPGPRSLLVDGENALLVPHGDPEALAAALRGLADDPDLARRLAERGLALAAEHTTEHIGRELHQILSSGA